MSALILIGLYFTFICRQYVNGMMSGSTGTVFGLTEDKAYFLIYLQMMAGVMVLNSVSFCTGIYGTLARDFETRRIDSFAITHVKRGEMVMAYLASGFAVSYILNILTWCITAVLITALTGYSIAVGTFFAVAAVLAFTSFISASIMLLVAAIVRSSAAVGVISGVIGTFFGFLCGIYMPLSQLGGAATKIGSLLPFTHVAVWLKGIVLGDAFHSLGITSPEFEAALLSNFSAENVGLFGMNVPQWVLLTAAGVFAVTCLWGALWVLKRRENG
jgi:multidrug/hemolysin transport system permease protein